MSTTKELTFTGLMTIFPDKNQCYFKWEKRIMITFKRINQVHEFGRMDERLNAILLWLLHEYQSYDLVVTEVERNRADQISIYTKILNSSTKALYRPEEVPFTVHGTKPCRGIDLYLTKNGWPLSKRICKKIEQHVNETFEYDPKRPNLKVCNYHKTSISGWHMHFQCHKNTEKRSLSIV